MAFSSSVEASTTDRYRSKAMRHAQDLEQQKSMRNTDLDLILELVDLPSQQNADPTRPLLPEATLFKRGLHIFQPSDFDDLILERNIYDKCGYGLCGRQNVKVAGNAQNRVIWGKRRGPAFTVVPKRELEKWCSKECEERAVFVRVQLGKEPVWLRDQPIFDIKLLDEIRHGREADALDIATGTLNVETPALGPNLADDLHKLALDRVEKYGRQDELVERLQALSLERGEPQEQFKTEIDMQIVEKAASQSIPRPPHLRHNNTGTIEGHRPRKVRFLTHGNHGGEKQSDDSDIEIDIRNSDDEEDAMSV